MCTYLDTVGSTYYFRRVVPLELRPYILTRTGNPRTEWKISLGTKDRAEAKRLLPGITEGTNVEIDAAMARRAREDARNVPEATVGRRSRNPGAQTGLYARLAQEQADRREARRRLREEMEDTARSFSTSELDPIHAIIKDIMREREEAAQGQAQPEVASRIGQRTAVPLIDLFDSYAKEQGMSPVTAQDWKGVLRSLVRFVGHDDATRLVVDDIDRWRDMLLSEATKRGGLRSPRTVKDNYLSALRSTLNYAVSKRKLPENVASTVTVRIPRQPKLRERDFTDAEAASILSATLKLQTDAPALTQRARRWIPWLCAYTGARVNEISQLRGSDVVEVEGVWTIHITPEAGRVKSGEARTVPLHPHIIEQGFLALVDQVGAGALFYDPGRVRKPGAANRHVSKVGERLAAWVREEGGVADPNVSPNHGWRHTFKTRALEAGMPERFMDAIQGHAARSVGQTYGRVPIKTLAEAVAKLPRFAV
ncbi:site-specific integrase [Sphingomonas sp. CFBP 13720]|uniref:site-specific integrase n=1 Tax=Sphingomonas sp. CFBP 13720 TaxID=2775302 RepID=UPI00177BEFCE|nr:site-specific integrase [Sphingomonas sp. CFBP 13720]MBD8680002.1 site-specific integrase [Sphingomonas sp. CFBP 13720]